MTEEDPKRVAYTQKVAEREDVDLADPVVRAALVLRNTGDTPAVDLEGYRLSRGAAGTWEVAEPVDFEDYYDTTLVDELRPERFGSARSILAYLNTLPGGDSDGGSQDQDDARPLNRTGPGVV